MRRVEHAFHGLSLPAQHPPVQQPLHIPPAVANDVNVDRLLSDFVDDAIHAGNDLAVLGRVEGGCRRAFKFDHLCALNFDQG